MQLETVDIILFFFKSSVGFISSRTALSKTSGMSQNIGVTSLTTLGVIQEPIGVIPKSATYSLYSLFVVVVVVVFLSRFSGKPGQARSGRGTRETFIVCSIELCQAAAILSQEI